jgi:hypothetical protein
LFRDCFFVSINTHAVKMMKIYDGLLITMISIEFSDNSILLLEGFVFDVVRFLNSVVLLYVLDRLLMEHTLTRSAHSLGMCQSEDAF